MGGRFRRGGAEATLSGSPGRLVMAGLRLGRGGLLAREGGVVPGAG